MSQDTRIVGTVFVKPAIGAVFNTTPESTFNSFGQASVGPGVFGTVVSFTPSSPTKLRGVIGYGDTDAEYKILVGSVVVGGFRTSPTNRTVQVSFSDAPISVSGGTTVEVQAKHEIAGAVDMKATILGGI